MVDIGTASELGARPSKTPVPPGHPSSRLETARRSINLQLVASATVANRRLLTVEADLADLRVGNGQWAHPPAGAAARTVRAPEPDLGRPDENLPGRRHGARFGTPGWPTIPTARNDLTSNSPATAPATAEDTNPNSDTSALHEGPDHDVLRRRTTRTGHVARRHANLAGHPQRTTSDTAPSPWV